MTIHYLFDAGHGGKDPGAVANGIHEKDINLYMAVKTAEYLTDGWEDVKVTQTRDSDTFLELTERTDLANQLGVTGFVSFHVNAGGGTGFETHVYLSERTSSSAYKLSKSIYDEVMKMYDGAGRGIKHTNLHVTRETDMKATLLEMLFIDRLADADLLKSTEFKNKLALAIAAGIAKHEGLKAKKTGGDKVESKNDIAGHWAEQSLQKAIDKGVLKGYGDGTYRPDEPLTLARFMVIMDRLGLLD